MGKVEGIKVKAVRTEYCVRTALSLDSRPLCEKLFVYFSVVFGVRYSSSDNGTSSKNKITALTLKLYGVRRNALSYAGAKPLCTVWPFLWRGGGDGFSPFQCESTPREPTAGPLYAAFLITSPGGAGVKLSIATSGCCGSSGSAASK